MDYAKVSVKFWTGETGKKLRNSNLATRVMAMYLISNPLAHMIGLYYLPIVLMAHEINIPLEDAEASLLQLTELEFCDYDECAEFVWVFEMARFQIGEQLRPNDKQIIASIVNTILCLTINF